MNLGDYFSPMLAPWQWAAIAAVPPAIVLLYFLKLKRKPLEVPSTYLWHKSIEDLHVNSIWQRLRRSLLLFLQLLLVALVALALLRPSWQGTKSVEGRLIFLIDNSASMSATDVGPSRLDEAKKKVAQIIDEQMTGGQVAMLVTFADGARVEQPFTDNRRQLERQLAAVGPTIRGTSLAEALSAAAGLANPGRLSFERGDIPAGDSQPATMYIFSDGKFPDVSGFSLGNLTPQYVPIGQPNAPNMAITAFSAERGERESDHLEVFARLENFGSEPVTLQANLYRGDVLLDSSKVSVPGGGPRGVVDTDPLDVGLSYEVGPAGGTQGVVFELHEPEPGVLRLAIEPGGVLASDDQAWITISPPRLAKVLLVSPGNDSLVLGLKSAGDLAETTLTEPAFLETKEYADAAAKGTFDLVIFDQCRPKDAEAMPQSNTLFVGGWPPSGGWSALDRVEAPAVIDVETAHPLMQLVDFGDVLIRGGHPLVLPQGGSRLVDTNLGTVAGIAPREGFEDVAFGIELVGVDAEGERYANTNWPLRPSFPVFLRNAVKYLSGARETAGLGSVSPGRPLPLRSQKPLATLEVRKPDGQTLSVPRSRQNTYDFAGTDQLGAYEVLEDGKVTQSFTVNLFDSRESDVRPREKIELGATTVKGQRAFEVARRDAWKPLALLALVVLLIEWYIYNRRVYL